MRKNLFDYPRNLSLKLFFAFSIFFLFAPIVAIIVYSFNDSRRIYFWKGFTFANYGKAINDSALVEAFINSLTIALVSTVLSLILGLFSAYAIYRFKFWGKSLYQASLGLPIVIPEIVMGVSLLVFFNQVFGSISVEGPWPLNLSLLIIAHTTFSFPFVSMIISARLQLFNHEQIEAAFDLGASEIKGFVDVVIPFLRPAMISGALLAFTLSLDDFMITFFTSGPNTLTFPIKIYSMLRFSVTPVVNAASTILILITFTMTIIGIMIQRKSFFKQF